MGGVNTVIYSRWTNFVEEKYLILPIPIIVIPKKNTESTTHAILWNIAPPLYYTPYHPIET